MPMLSFVLTLLLSAHPAPAAAPDAMADLIARSKAAYAKLTSYADEGTILEQLDDVYYKSSFRTYRRKPKDFYFEYRNLMMYSKSGSLPGREIIVYWMKNGNLETWDLSLKSHESYPAGQKNQVAPIASSGYSTKGSLTLIAGMLFQTKAIVNDLEDLATGSVVGVEKVEGHPCEKLVGIAQSHYPSGASFNTRPVTIWFDAQTYMIRKMVIDTPKNAGVGSIHRFTLTFNPVMNPVLDDSKFEYKIPGNE